MIGRHAQLALALACVLSGISAQDPAPAKQETKALAELKKRMRGRYATLSRLRDKGLVGETYDGRVATVKAETDKQRIDPKKPAKGTIGELVAAENKDRKALYAILAQKNKTSTVKIARQNGIRNLNRAKPEHQFRLKSGKWVKRKNIRKKPRQH